MISQALRKEALAKLHTGHLGITKCQERAKQSVWWPRIRKHIEEVQKYLMCSQFHHQTVEPLIPTNFPDYPWQKVAAELFTWKGTNYLICSSLILLSLNQNEQTEFYNFIFCDTTHQIDFSKTWHTGKFVSDNGPQFSSVAFTQFAMNYGFHHQTSSPNYPQSNGKTEHAVQTVKSMLNKATDPYLGLLFYRAIPLANGYSPAELLMGRKLCSTIPMISEMYKPNLPPHSEILQKEQLYCLKQQRKFNKCHRACQLKP